jgi:cyclic pyranopterin monophosphate synthase
MFDVNIVTWICVNYNDRKKSADFPDDVPTRQERSKPDSLFFSEYIYDQHMRDISDKTTTARSARAEALLKLRPETLSLVRDGKVPKGDPLPVAKVAAVQAAKNTSQIIPYCHPIPIDLVDCRFDLGSDTIKVTAEVKAVAKTGVEMEALTAATVAALTLYDMLKPVDSTMEIVGISLVEKRGGKSDFAETHAMPLRAAVLVMSDSIAAGFKKDTSGLLICERLREKHFEVVEHKVLPDDQKAIEATLTRYADSLKLNLVVTTGGTGLSGRDVTPEAMKKVIEREIPGIAETARGHGQQRTPLAMLSRGMSGLRGSTIIVNLPGSQRAVGESLDAILPGLVHVFRMLRGEGH